MAMSEMDEIRRELAAIRKLLEEIKQRTAPVVVSASGDVADPVSAPPGTYLRQPMIRPSRTFAIIERTRLDGLKLDLQTPAGRPDSQFVVVAPVEFLPGPLDGV
jgi:hypothetical protein